jgi:hypothetical protein
MLFALRCFLLFSFILSGFGPSRLCTRNL